MQAVAEDPVQVLQFDAQLVQVLTPISEVVINLPLAASQLLRH